MNEPINKIFKNLESFYAKYYFSKMIAGGALFLLYAFLIGISLIFIEYFVWFSSELRTILFYTYLLFLGVSFYFLFVTNFLKRYRLKKRINSNLAATLIGKHFKEIDDKLINLIELNQQMSLSESTLIMASIKQKTEELSRFKFSLAVSFNEVKKHFKWLLLALGSLALILIIYPQLISQPTYRFIHYSKNIKPPAPFTLNFLTPLEGSHGRPYKLKIAIKEGDFIPKRLRINYENKSFALTKTGKAEYNYDFPKLSSEVSFSIFSSGYQFGPYSIKVHPNPNIRAIKLTLEYPKYLNRKKETVSDNGDVLVPLGTKITWDINTVSCQKLVFLTPFDTIDIQPFKNNLYSYTKIADKDLLYSLIPFHDDALVKDTIPYTLKVIPDKYPQISLTEVKDSGLLRSYFKGTIIDDYGFSSLTFNYVLKSADKEEKKRKIPIKVTSLVSSQEYHYEFDFSTLEAPYSSNISYFFEVKDNDYVSGPKATKSDVYNLFIKSKAQIEQEVTKAQSQFKSSLSETLNQLKSFKDKTNKQKEALELKKKVSWSEKKQMKETLKKYKKTLQKLKAQINRQKQVSNKEKQLSKSPEIAKKQEKIDKLLEDSFTDEMKKMLDELNEMLKNRYDKNTLEDKMGELQAKQKNIENDVERMLELYKKLLLEKNLMLAKEKLDSLSTNQKRVAEIAEKSKSKQDSSLLKDQQKINKSFDKLSKKIDKLQKNNKVLSKPSESLKQTDAISQKVEQKLEESLKKLEKNRSDKASDAQKGAGKEMDNLSDALQSSIAELQDKSEDIKAMRQLLSNLIFLSIEQEKLIKQLLSPKSVESYSFSGALHSQNKLKNDAKFITDSLFALSKRNESIQPIINKEANIILFETKKVLENLADLKLSDGLIRQQKVMTSTNKLALIVDESIQNAQSIMSLESKGKGSKGKKKKPLKGSSLSLGKKRSLKQMQSELSEQLSQLLKMMKENQGKSSGKSGKGSKKGKGSREESKMFSNAYNNQAKIRKDLFDKMAEQTSLNQLSKMKAIQKMMKEQEDDIVNKAISGQTTARQEQILAKLLEYENAQREQGEESKRESNSVENWKEKLKTTLTPEKMKKKFNKEQVIYKQIKLTPYFQEKTIQFLSN